MYKSNEHLLFSLALKKSELIIPLSVVVVFSIAVLLFSFSGIKMSIMGVLFSLFGGYIVSHLVITAYSIGRKQAKIEMKTAIQKEGGDTVKLDDPSEKSLPLNTAKKGFDPVKDFSH